MVCNRCILVVKQELDKLHIEANNVVMGEVDTKQDLTDVQLAQFASRLTSLGFELLDDSKQQLIEKIKKILIHQVHYASEISNHNISDILSAALLKDYAYLSRLFSDVEGITIEKYLINQKIEKVKELIIYDELSLSEIAFKLGYSSVAHLSNQFKKVTGLTPSYFKKAGQQKRKPLDEV